MSLSVSASMSRSRAALRDGRRSTDRLQREPSLPFRAANGIPSSPFPSFPFCFLLLLITRLRLLLLPLSPVRRSNIANIARTGDTKSRHGAVQPKRDNRLMLPHGTSGRIPVDPFAGPSRRTLPLPHAVGRVGYAAASKRAKRIPCRPSPS